jgi:RNA methyltransferase, TrmH family
VIDQPIESPANPRIKAAVRLRDRRERDLTGLTLVDGARELRRALEAGVSFEDVFFCPPLVRSAGTEAVVRLLEERQATIVPVSEKAYAKVAFGDRPDGIVAVIHAPSTDLKDIVLPPDPLVVVLEGVEKPGNIGAVARSADGAGANALVLADPRTDVYNPNAIRASVGTIFALPLGAHATPHVRHFLASQNVRVVAARPDGGALPWEVDLTGAIALVLGNEAEGLGERWVGDEVIGVRIPMLGVADSLNVSVAAAILLYEARRQRT